MSVLGFGRVGVAPEMVAAVTTKCIGQTRACKQYVITALPIHADVAGAAYQSVSFDGCVTTSALPYMVVAPPPDLR